MKKIRILYWVQKRLHVQLFVTFVERPDVVQAVVVPSFISRGDLQIKSVYKYNDMLGLKQTIKKFKPDILVQCDTSAALSGKLKKYGIKVAFVLHGIWNENPVNVHKASSKSLLRFDMLFGGTHRFRRLLEKYSETDGTIITNALPQLDTLHYRLQDEDSIRKEFLHKANRTECPKIVTLFGHKCSSRNSVIMHNEDYYRAAIELGEIAKKYNWLVFVKPKKDTHKVFLNQMCKNSRPENDWAREIRVKYNNLQNDGYVCFVSPEREAYKYFCVDAIVSTARSSVEIESALASKPLVIVNTKTNDIAGNDVYGTVKHGAAHFVDDMGMFESTMLRAVYGDNTELMSNQEKFVKHLELTFDGKAHERIIMAIQEELNAKSNNV